MDNQFLSNCLYLFGNLVRIYLIYQILKIFFIEEDDKKKHILQIGVYILFFVVNSMGFLCFHWNSLGILLSNIVGVMIITILYQGKWKYRIIATAMVIALSLACEDIAYRVVVNLNINHIVAVTMAIADILILIVTLLLQKYFQFRNGEDVFTFEWIGIVAILSISAFVSAIIFDRCNDENTVIIGEICLLLLDTIVLYLFDHLIKLYYVKVGIVTLQEQNTAYEKQLNLLRQSEKNWNR